MALRKTRTYEYSQVGFDSLSAMRLSGLEYMRAMVAGEIGAPPPIGAHLERGRCLRDAAAVLLHHDLESGVVLLGDAPRHR